MRTGLLFTPRPARSPDELKGRMVAFYVGGMRPRSTRGRTCKDRRPSGFRWGRVVRVYWTKRRGLDRVTVSLAGGRRHKGYDGPHMTVFASELRAQGGVCGVQWRGRMRALDDWLEGAVA